MSLGLSLGLSLRSQGSSAPAWTPASLAGVEAWLRADLGVTNSGGVTAWADQSGSGDAGRIWAPDGTDKPTYNASLAGFNGQAALGPFNTGPNDDVTLKSGTWSETLSTPTIIMVFTAPTTGNRYACYEQESDYAAIVQSANQVKMFAGNGAATSLSSGISASTLCITIAEFNGSSSKVFVNGFVTARASGTLSATTVGNSGLRLGRYPASAASFGVEYIAEVIILSTPYSGMSVADRAALATYLNDRYGTSYTVPT